MDATTTTGAMPVWEVNKEGGQDFMSGGYMWIFFLFFLLAWGGGGLFGNNSAGGQITNDFAFTNLAQKMDTGFTQLANQNFGIDKDILQSQNAVQMALCAGFNGVNQNLNQLGYNMENCCCTTNRNIDSVKYDNAQQTNALLTASCNNTQRVLDKLCQMESAAKDETIYSLRTDLQTANNVINNAAQTNTLINTLRPVPIPAYPVTSPYQAYYPYSYSYACGCNGQ